MFLTPSLLWAALVTGQADGFASGVTGGGTAAVVRPASLSELEKALCDRFEGPRCTDVEPRVIPLDHVFDFTGSRTIDGSSSRTETGCIASRCPAPYQGQVALNVAHHCDGRALVPVAYDNAGVHPLEIGSNKTIGGIGPDAGIRGRGLRVGGGNRNVIIQNIRITDIDRGVVWGGDACRWPTPTACGPTTTCSRASVARWS